jgi:hypothetical protein
VDGMWGTREVVAADGTPRGLAFAGKPIVLYQVDGALYVKTRSP